MFDPRTFYADIKPVACLTLELRMEFAAKESSNIVWFYCVNRCLGQVAVDGRQLGLHCPEQKHPIKTTQLSGDLFLMALG